MMLCVDCPEGGSGGGCLGLHHDGLRPIIGGGEEEAGVKGGGRAGQGIRRIL